METRLRMQLQRRGLTAIRRARVVRRLITKVDTPEVDAPAELRCSAPAPPASIKLLKSGEARRNINTPRRKIRYAIFAQIVGPLRPRLLPMTMPRNKSLPQHGHVRVGQRIAIFIRHPSAQHRCSLQTHVHVLQFLSCGQRQHASLGALVTFIRIQET